MSTATDKIVLESTEQGGRRGFLAAAITAGAAYAAAIGYPVYRYLASPVEKAEAEAAVTEVTLKDAQKLPTGSALMFKFGSQPAMLIHHARRHVDRAERGLHASGLHGAIPAGAQRIHCACHGGEYDPRTGAERRRAAAQAADALRVKVTDEAAWSFRGAEAPHESDRRSIYAGWTNGSG